MKTPWPILSDIKYSMVKDIWKLAFEAQESLQALAGTPVGTPSVVELPCGPTQRIDLQI
jgi:hypothetical protein